MARLGVQPFTFLIKPTEPSPRALPGRGTCPSFSVSSWDWKPGCLRPCSEPLHGHSGRKSKQRDGTCLA